MMNILGLIIKRTILKGQLEQLSGVRLAGIITGVKYLHYLSVFLTEFISPTSYFSWKSDYSQKWKLEELEQV